MKIVPIIAKILEVVCFALFVAFLVLLAVLMVQPDAVQPLFDSMLSENNGEMTVNGITIVAMQEGNVVGGTTLAYALAGLVSFACYTMVFRNVGLIFKTAAGKTRFPEDATPFQKPVVRMVRETGIFFALIPATGLVLGAVLSHIAGNDITRVELGGLFAGFVLIALSTFFAYGETLEDTIKNKSEL